MDSTNMSAAQFEAMGESLSDGKQLGDTIRYWHYDARGGCVEQFGTVVGRYRDTLQVRWETTGKTQWVFAAECSRY